MPERADPLTLDDLTDDALAAGPILVRVDFNVPLEAGQVTDGNRLEQARPTLEELCSRGGRLLLASHCGRPKGERRPELSLRPVAEALAEILGRDVRFADDCIGTPVAEAVEALRPGDVCLLENLRFHAGEEANEAGFAASLAAPASAYVNDAFATAHRAHASVHAAVRGFSNRAAGRLMVTEVETLSTLLAEPTPPFTTILGGAKVSGKIDTLRNLLVHSQRLLIAGGMANTFLAANGLELGRSLLEPSALDLARELLAIAAGRGVEVVLPTDLVVTDRLESPTVVETVPAERVPAELMAVDIGAETAERFAAAIATSGTLFWNGPCGVFEVPPFDAGSLAVARAVAASAGTSVVGGGETGAVVARAGLAERIDHLSTGGGASLALLAGKTLPALEVLRRHS